MTNEPRDTGLSAAAWAAVYVGVAAATLPTVLPVMVGVLADKLAFGNVRAGYVAAANMGGVALGSLICAVLARRWPWRTLIRAGTATLIGANILSMWAAAFPSMAISRSISGLGEGVVQAVCYAAMGRSGQPARALGLYLAGQGLTGAIGMAAIPTVVARLGWPWLFVLVSAVALPCFWLALPIQTLARAVPVEAVDAPAAGRRSIYALSGILIFFIGMSAVWSFVERMGQAKGIGLAQLSIALSASSLANVLGALFVAILAHRLSDISGVIAGSCMVLCGLTGLVVSHDWRAYLAAVSVFFFAWGFFYPFQFRLLTRTDADNGITVLLPLMTGGGFTAGPALGGLLLTAGGPLPLCIFGAVCVAASTAAAMHLYFRCRGNGKNT